jgi:hypothetical protein
MKRHRCINHIDIQQTAYLYNTLLVVYHFLIVSLSLATKSLAVPDDENARQVESCCDSSSRNPKVSKA